MEKNLKQLRIKRKLKKAKKVEEQIKKGTIYLLTPSPSNV